jgi:phosphoglucosamine mutase
MKQGGFTLGGEQSGHVILLNHQTTGDGVLTALALAMIMKTNSKKMSELNNKMKKYPQIIVNASVRNELKDIVLANPEVHAEIAAAEAKYEGRGRVLVRKSGTEALIRVMIEGLDAGEIAADAEILAKFLEGAANK